MIGEKKPITIDQLQRQVAEYNKQYPDYKLYADALLRVLKEACRSAFPDAFVQARPKSITSFAEKCVRRFDKYPDAINQMTDLCGGRVIVQTLEQVKAVRQFIDANFTVLEADEKGLSLGDDKFGYRDMHYVVRLKPEKAEAMGFSREEIARIGDKRAEVQVRTWVQHAWADTLHDRMYKTKLKYSAETRRTGALLAAIMEDGDRAFNRLAGDIDGMLANFNAYAAPDETERELAMQRMILTAAEDEEKPKIALQIARLLAARGEYKDVVDTLAAYERIPSPLGCAIRLELGHALCRQHRATPQSDEYRRGQKCLERVVEHCGRPAGETVADLRRRKSALARAYARLAWSHETTDADAHLAREEYHKALELEPANPYYLADVIGHEINYCRRNDFVAAMASTVRQALATCREHVRNGTEMPYAAFTAGRLHLLLGETDPALGLYALGVRHVLANTGCTPPDVLDAERRWLVLVTKPAQLAGGHLWATKLLNMADALRTPPPKGAVPPAHVRKPVLIVAGGAATLTSEQAEQLTPMLAQTFEGFTGTIISGGTKIGVPGCAGEAADTIAPKGKRPFNLIGYLPPLRPDDAPKDNRYDGHFECGRDAFTAEQILRNWEDILAAGIRPDEVRLLGVGGGSVSAAEYRIALGLGACAGVVVGSGGAADELLKDDLWSALPNLLALPCDRASFRALAHPPRAEFPPKVLEDMASAFHAEYVRNSTGKLPDNMKPWGILPDTYKTANLEQAKYAIQILAAAGFQVVPAAEPREAVVFTDKEIERMAELEHGRWNVERLRNGWRHGAVRDDARKLHPCLVPWTNEKVLTREFKDHDRNAVRKFPEILAKAGLKVVRK